MSVTKQNPADDKVSLMTYFCVRPVRISRAERKQVRRKGGREAEEKFIAKRGASATI